MVVEFAVGFLTSSLALISDAGHMATDALGVGMALAAITLATRKNSNPHRTFGLYRLEILAALANAVLLFAVAGYVLFEAFNRFGEPPEILAGPMLIAASLGLVVNVLCWWLLRDGARESVNVEGAALEVLADLISSIGVVLAGVVIVTTGWTYADSIVAVLIGLFILPRAYRLGRKALRILIQAAPEDVDMDTLMNGLRGIDGVGGVHDLHVWTLTSGMTVASAHLTTTGKANSDAVLASARDLLRDDHGVTHATLQVEGADQDCELTW